MPVIKKNKRVIESKLRAIRIFSKCNTNGCECLFYRNSKNSRIGYKVYEDWDTAKEAYKRQKKAYKRGLAPRVIGSLYFAIDKHGSCLGLAYKTQIAKPLKRSISINDERIQKVVNALGMIDVHEGNFGMIGDRVVCIDFGDCSF